MHQKSSNIYIGPAGWVYPDWKGIFYPAKLPPGETDLSFLAKYFNLVEINSSFYRIPTVKSVENWLAQIAGRPDFKFSCKLHQKFTHLPGGYSESDVAEFKQVLYPLQTNQRLLSVLIQFPWSFKYEPENRRRLLTLFEEFKEFPLAIEVRHQSWNMPRFIDYLREHSHTFVNIDQPVIGKSLQMTNYVTSKIVYFRFHGRNYDNWFKPEAGQNQRYNYLYSDQEQNGFLELIQKIMTEETTLLIVFNNHFRGQAVTNAFQLKFLFEGEKQNIPDNLIRAFPQLQPISIRESTGKMMSLFDEKE